MKEEIMICGVDCHPGDENCNGYCTGDVENPPKATRDVILKRRRKDAYEALQKAESAWYEYFKVCEVGCGRGTAHEIYERIRNVLRK